jgi:4-hydroxy-3-methylbut-2-enyl diphosphate reductase
MKFSAAVLVCVLQSSTAFVSNHPTSRPSFVLASTTTTDDASATQEDRRITKKDERLRMMKSEQFHRKGFKEVRDDVEATMQQQFQSEIVKDFRASNFLLEKDGVKVYLAKDFGFCWGVERSIALAYEAVNHFPGKTIHITNELIHNPEVNDKLHDMNVQFIEKVDKGQKNFETVKDGDVVILPAFGASFEEMDYLDKKVRH